MTIDPSVTADAEQARQSLSTAAARNLATTTKTPPQMQGISSRWLLKVLPWVQVNGGSYRVNRRLSFVVGDGKLTFTNVGDRISVVPQELGELPALRDFDDVEVLGELARRCEQREYAAGEVIAQSGAEADYAVLIAHGKVTRHTSGKYGNEVRLKLLGDGDYFGDNALTEQEPGEWPFTARAETRVIALLLPRTAFAAVLDNSPALAEQVQAYLAQAESPRNRSGEAEIEISSGHEGEPTLPSTFVDYELSPREYELSVAQTVLRVHTRVADLYNQPMNQMEQQLKLTIEALRERQEHELVNNSEFGLLANADLRQRVQTHSGPPTPDDLDELISRRRDTRVLLAHPKAIAAFAKQCTKAGIYPDGTEYLGHRVPAWRDVPLLPCNKIPIGKDHTTSIIAMRTGEDNQGVVGLHQTGIPDEYQPSLSVRFMGINEQAIMSYLVSAYYSAAVLVPDALGILENVEIVTNGNS
ncbi:family 2B encapsulin nanocompartment shell protein [Actinospica sp.]|uniref:family 2B encapsulin nanocompartment shell protein n=1 Tax=Actinospica sp. TaxID=1872142 RepID=UPI002C34CFCC|nr:family 2B encapsulin nanocompartment shell protein [Actinospica sp.]HWG27843.1 family 2B encapsulin nanocompartment shell protein [Actinospica sp.]